MTVSNLEKLTALVLNLPQPVDDMDHHSFLAPMQLRAGSASTDSFAGLVDEFMAATQGGRSNRDKASLRRHWEYILLNLSKALLSRRWLVVSLTSNAYTKDYWLKLFKLSHGATKAIVDYLDNEGLVVRKKGKQFKNGPLRTRLFPTAPLAARLWQFFLDSEHPITPPYLTIGEPEGKWKKVFNKLDAEHPDLIDMTTINDFLIGHQWACKGPVRLIYKHTPFQSGRLYTPFQNLPDRSVRIRINTLIDGEPICEVDFSANHLRINLAVMANEDAGETPYEDIGELAAIDDRNKIKNFITVAMGASNRDEAMNACYKESIDKQTFEAIESAASKRYPKLELFTGWGLFAQNLEGAIIRNVMLQGVAEGIVALPVHDAVAVQQRHAQWAQDRMLEAWAEAVTTDGVILAARSRLKIDYPD
jgi:hypothetical protein